VTTETDTQEAAARPRPGTPGLRDRVFALRGLLPMLPPALLTAPVDELTLRRAARRLGLAAPGRASRTTADLLVARVGSLALKYPLSERAGAALTREERVLTRLLADPRLDPGSRAILPTVLPRGRDGGRNGTIGLQPWMPGAPAPAFEDDPATAAALSAISRLHRSTGRPRRAAEPLLDSWLAPGLALLRTELGPDAAAGLDTVEDRLRAGLTDREMLCAWTHGDYHPGNVLLRRTDGGLAVSGVIDWVQGCQDGPAAIDGCMYLLARRHHATGRELGGCVVDCLRSGGLSADELKLLAEAGVDAPAYGPDGRMLPLLTWLWHVSSNVAKSGRYARSRRWVQHNIHPVLAAAGGLPAGVS
jgi:hypothetical protein